jgi:cysteine desulfurase
MQGDSFFFPCLFLLFCGIPYIILMIYGQDVRVFPMIYLDNAATTKTDPAVLEAMLPYFIEDYGNASSAYRLGQKSKRAIDRARESLAKSIGASSSELYFTSGGSESDNWALLACFEAFPEKKHIITSAIEHPAILKTLSYLEKRGAEITRLPVDEKGLLHPADLEAAIREDTCLVSIMFANNEIGTIEPIAELGQICQDHKVLFHTDAVQAYGHIPIDVKEMHIDLLSASGHKLNGPKGIGFLYIKEGLPLASLIHGGAQERNRRAGTENVPAIIGFAKAGELAMQKLPLRMDKQISYRDHFIAELKNNFPNCRINGSLQHRLPNNINVSFPGRQGETLLIQLDMHQICASAGSACSSGSLDPSHVLTAIGLDEEMASSTLRFSISHETTIEELEQTIAVLKEIL